MGLKIEDAPRELQPGTWTEVWPGDSGVDQDASNISKWAEEGGEAGIVLNADEKPDKITCRRLEPDEERYIAALALGGNTGKALMAIRTFQIGCVKIDGMRWVLEEDAGVLLMPRKTLNVLMKHKLAITIKREGQEDKEVVMSLPEIVGQHIFQRSFRE